MKKIYIDTDVGADCDDIGALAIALQAEKLGYCSVIGISHTTSSPYAADAIAIMLDYFGKKGMTIGCLEDEHQFYDESVVHYDQAMVEAYPNIQAKIEEAVRYARKALVTQEDGSVTFVTIGPLRNLADLLRSEPDDISPLDGAALFHKKVKEWVFMGGRFDEERIGEYNIVCDIENARHCLEEIRVPTMASDFLLGEDVISGILSKDIPPLRLAYDYFSGKGKGRSSWDPITMDYAIYGLGEHYDASPRGIISLQSKGVTVFEENPTGHHRYLVCKTTKKKIEHNLNHKMEGTL